MNNRIAKKVLQCASSLSLNKEAVYAARTQAISNPEYFIAKGLHLVPMANDDRDCSKFWRKS